LKPETAPSILYKLLVCPSEAMAAARDARPVGLAVAIVAVALLSQQVAVTLFDGAYEPTAMSVGVFTAALTFKACLVLCVWPALAALCHTAAGLFGGYGRPTTCFAVIGLSAMPLVFAAPAANTVHLLGAADSFVYSALIVPALWLWVILLATIGLRQAYRVSAPAAFGCAVLPPLVLLAGGAAISLFGMLYAVRALAAIIKLALAG
jgi:hypothetical protein